MKHCKHCNDTLFTEIYDTCMTCFEKQPAESTMTKTIEQYQQDALWYQNEIKRLESCCSNLQGVVKGDAYNIKRLSEENERLVKIYNDQRDILDKILFELPVGSVTSHSYENIPVGNVTSHSYENIPERVAYYVRESAECSAECEKLHDEKTKAVNDYLLLQVYTEEDTASLQSLEKAIKTHYEYYSGFAANKHLSAIQMLDVLFKNNLGSGETQVLRAELEALKVKSRLFKSTQDGQEYLRCLHQEGDKHQSVGLWILDCLSYKESLEEIIKRPRKSETYRLIAQKALGLLSDDEYQPELLIEENLKLKMKIEDLESLIIDNALNKIYPEKVNPLMCCEDCGEYWDYHHEQHCKANL